MEKSPQWQTRIPASESKSQYLELMEEMRGRQARQLEARELDIWIKEMHAHIRGIELEQEEEELREHKRISRRGKKNYLHVSESWKK
jgi:hypothetical protein